jgi:hypothetical protein
MEFRLLIILTLLLCSRYADLYAQDAPALPHADKVAGKYLDAVAGKSAAISGSIDKQTDKYLSKFQKEEKRLFKKLAKKDSTAAGKALTASQKQYQALQQKLNGASQKLSRGRKYIPLLDTLGTSLKFLKQYGDLFKKGMASSQQLNTSLSEVNTLEGKLQKADDVQAFIKERREQLTEQLQKAGMGDALKGFNKDAYYYSAQMKEYSEALNDPGKAEQKALALLNQLPAFKQFMKQNSFLSSIFGAPDNATATGAAALQGLQTREQVQQLIQNQVSAGGPGAQAMVQANIQAAQAQLNTLKDKLSKLGGGNSESDIPDFKPNNQRTKTFFQRLEYGTNIQTQKSGYFFPTTTDLALSVGYKLNDKSTIGIGTSYKMGWGRDIQHIAISHQGIGFRFFADMKLKGSFWLSGGAELNYKAAFRNFEVLDDFSPWQKSALLGVTKKYKASKKLKGNVQLLYDFLWHQQIPVAQPVVIRIGYSFN